MMAKIASGSVSLRPTAGSDDAGRQQMPSLVPSLHDILSARRGLKPATERFVRQLEVPVPPRTFLDDIRTKSFVLRPTS
jgi:hypothetical protein